MPLPLLQSPVADIPCRGAGAPKSWPGSPAAWLRRRTARAGSKQLTGRAWPVRETRDPTHREPYLYAVLPLHARRSLHDGARLRHRMRVAAGSGRVTPLARGRYPVDPDWSPDRRRIVFSDWGLLMRGARLPVVAVLTLRTGAIRNLRAGWHPRWSPDGRRITFVCPPAICVMQADGSGLHRLTGT